MVALAPRLEVLRPEKKGLGAALLRWTLDHLDLIFSVLRRIWPIAGLRSPILVTRHDDVREVLLSEADFQVTYAEKLDVLMGGQPFFLGLDDSAEVGRAVDTLRLAVRPDDVVALAERAAARSADLADLAGETLEVVDHVRQVTFDVFSDYLGISSPPGQDLRLVATRLFEFLLVDPFKDPDLRAEAEPMAKRLRDHIDDMIRDGRSRAPADNVLGRCLRLQAEKRDGFTDVEIRTNLVGLIVGGLPQPAMAAAQSLDQLLARPAELMAAQAASRSDDDAALRAYVFEALRFDPIAPMLVRRCARDRILAAGTWRARRIKSGATVMAVVASAMKDPRRISDPERFDPGRVWHAYLHFGQGLHGCFAMAFCQALIPAMLKPLLRREGLTRARGPRGRLSKRGFVADQLWVTFA